jgi:N-acetylmuramic acid 6-phosphate etherase
MPDHPQVTTGIEVFLQENRAEYAGQTLAVLTGSGACTTDLIPTAVALQARSGLRIAALFAPEHGLYGAAAAGAHMAASVDPATGLPIHSLYGDHQEPTGAMLAGIDSVLVDLQDVGLRYYTYASTVHAMLRAAARHGTQVVLLDRPNPLTGMYMDGPVAERAFLSFVGTTEVPIRHGLTLGELALWINDRDDIHARLQVVPMRGWQRDAWFDATGLTWAPPSPNIPTAETCPVYGATCLIEGTPVSEGRGTTQPFEVLGAPWIDAYALAATLNRCDLPGVRFRPTWFMPTSSKHAGTICGGVQVHIHDRLAFQAVTTGLQILAALLQLYPDRMDWRMGAAGVPFLDLLLGSAGPRLALERGEPVDRIVASWQPALDAFAEAREPFLLYPAGGAAQAAAPAALATTETINPRTADIDTLGPLEIVRLINEEDALVPAAVARELPAIANVVERVADAFRAGGRLIYVGAGTSGRLAVLDAAECPPTYGTPPSQVVALIAGGAEAMTRSIEGAEDDAERGTQEIDLLNVSEHDVVVGVAASGSTPYVVGALRRAAERGAFTVAVVGNADGPVAKAAVVVVAPETGPEVIAGSTRMKAGTAQKLVLNMISTAAMIRAGRTYRNLMVYMQAANDKLRERSRRIVQQATGATPEAAARALHDTDQEMVTAIVVLLAGVDTAQARERLARAGGVVREALLNAEQRGRQRNI